MAIEICPSNVMVDCKWGRVRYVQSADLEDPTPRLQQECIEYFANGHVNITWKDVETEYE